MIPLSVPNLSGNEWKYIKDCLDTNWVSSVGSYVTQFEKAVADFCGVRCAIATSNGTSAIHISLLLAGVEPGDLVVAPNITFVAPVNAIKYAGADPVLIDVEEGNWQMDLSLLEKFLQNDTRSVNGSCIHKGTGRKIAALLPVHILGNIGDLDKLLQLAEANHIVVVEDATEALGSLYKGRHAGSFGVFGCLSFNGNKLITTGGGGMMLTNNEELGKKAKHLTTQAKADPEEYYHDAVGYNYRLVNILAAMGVAQMEQLPGFLKRKNQINHLYNAGLAGIPGVYLQAVDTENVQPNFWLYTIRCSRSRELRAYLKARQIEVRPLWAPMNTLPAFKDCIFINEENVSAKLYESCLSIPCSTGITDEEVFQVIAAIKEFYNQ